MRDSGARIGVLDLVATVVVTAAVQPFVQAIASKAGEEVWPKIAGLVRPGRREELGQGVEESDLLEIAALDGRLAISMPKRLPPEAARDLRDVVATLQEADGNFRISYDAPSRSWQIAQADPGQALRAGDLPPDT
ncbi:hypothetical protein AQJ23_34990 [Streptomyces antibioticus]|nr:hypothetical protein AQJ23_34990 [Streptomyces antibioticus]